jgi:hypothetical protein
VLVLIVYTSLAFSFFHLTWQHPSERLIGQCCDPAAVTWFLRWPGYALAHHLGLLSSNYAGIRSGFNVMWQPPAMLPVGLVFSPFEALFGPFVTYNLVVTTAMATSGWACYAVMRRWVGGFLGPFVAGLMFGFSSYMTSQSIGHPQFMILSPVLFCFLLLSDLIVYQRRPAWQNGVALGALGSLEFLISQEIFVGMLIAGAVATVVIWLTHQQRAGARIGRVGAGLILALCTGAVLLAWPLGTEFLGGEQLHGTLRPQNLFVTDVDNLVLPNPAGSFFKIFGGGRYALLWGWDLGEVGAYVGPPLLLLVVIVFVRFRRNLFVRVCGVTGLLMLLLSFGPSLHIAGRDSGIRLPWSVFERFPLLQSALPVRFDVFWQLAVAGLAAMGVRAIMAVQPARMRAIGLFLVIVSLIPLLPTLDYATWTPEVPRFFQTTAVDEIPAGSVVFTAPFPRADPWDVDPMLWQVTAGMRFRMPGGYIFFPAAGGSGLADPGGVEDPLTARFDLIAETADLPALSAPELRQMRSIFLSKYQPQFGLVGPMANEGAAVQLMTSLVGHGPRYIEGIYLWRVDQSVTAH